MKKDPLADKVTVSTADYHKAECTWNLLYNKGSWYPNDFLTFLGRDTIYMYVQFSDAKPVIFLSQRAADKVAMLCSRHARTLMQAFIIRTGYHKKLPK